MKKIIFIVMMFFSSLCLGANVSFYVEEVGLSTDKVENLEFKVTVKIESERSYKRFSTIITPFSDISIFQSGTDRDISTNLELEVKDDFIKNLNENRKRFYVARIKNGFDVLFEKKFTFVLGARGVTIEEGHPIF